MHNVLDAMRVGNKSRYANHSKDPNAYAKVVFVNGNQKIGLYAKRLLLPGTEILYNYMWANHFVWLWYFLRRSHCRHECMDVVPEWQKLMEESKAARKHAQSVPRGTEINKNPKPYASRQWIMNITGKLSNRCFKALFEIYASRYPRKRNVTLHFSPGWLSSRLFEDSCFTWWISLNIGVW